MADKKIRVLLISTSAAARARMREMVRDDSITVIGDAAGGLEVLDDIENTSPDIIVMTFGAGDHDVLNLAERVILHRPKTFVVLLVDSLESELLQRAMEVGAHNVTTFPASPKDFAEYLKTVYNAETIRLNSLVDHQGTPWMSQVVTVYGAKGGVGKTTIAVNLAVSLARRHRKVALVDLNLQFGDVNVFLDIEPKDTIVELVQDMYVPDIDAVRSYMVVHSSGVHVLCAPRSPEYAEVVSSEKVKSLISLMRSYYDYVIIDTSPSLDDVAMTAIESSTTILFVVGLDVSILRNSRTSLAILDSLQQKEKVKVVVNRAVEMNTVTIEDVRKITGCPICAALESDYKVAISALNRGVPLAIGSPDTRLSHSIDDLAGLLVSGMKDFDIKKSPGPKARKRTRQQHAAGRRGLFRR